MSYTFLRIAVWAATLVVVLILAFTRGRGSERWAAGGLFLGWLVTLAVYRHGTEGTQWALFAVDAILLAILIWIALLSRRYWPIFAAGFHLLAVVTHLAEAIDAHVHRWAYITAEIIWGYLLAFVIGYGAWTAPRSRDATGGAPNAAPGATRR